MADLKSSLASHASSGGAPAASVSSSMDRKRSFVAAAPRLRARSRKSVDAFAGSSATALKSVRRYRVKMWAEPSEERMGDEESKPMHTIASFLPAAWQRIGMSMRPRPSGSMSHAALSPSSGGTGMLKASTEAGRDDSAASGNGSVPPLSPGSTGDSVRVVKAGDNAVVVVEEDSPVCIINPHGSFMQRWDFIMILCLLFTAIVTPVEVSFFDASTGVDGMWIVNRVVDVLFFMDVFITFFLPYVDVERAQHITDLRAIAYRYASGMLTFDLVTVLPYDIIANYAISSASSSVLVVRFVRIARILKLARMLRVVRANRIFTRWKAHFGISNGVISLTRFTAILILEAHWIACLWNMTAVFEGPTSHTWLSNVPDIADTLTPWERYVASLYFSTMTITTIGYGDISPVNTAERSVAICAMIVGGGLYAFVIGSMSSIIANLDRASGLIAAQRDDLNSYMAEIKLPQPLRVQLREYFDQCGQLFRHTYYKELLGAMSPALRGQVATHIHSEWISRIPWFNPPNSEEQVELVTAVASLVQMEAFAPLEVVVREGHVADRLYIVHRGLAMTTIGRIVTSGNYFGDAMLLTRGRWMETVRSFTYLYTLSLHRDALDRLLDTGNFEGTRKLIRRTVIRLAFRREFTKAATISRMHRGFLGRLTGAATNVANHAIVTRRSSLAQGVGGSFVNAPPTLDALSVDAQHTTTDTTAGALRADTDGTAAASGFPTTDTVLMSPKDGATRADLDDEGSPQTAARRLWRRSVSIINAATTMLMPSSKPVSPNQKQKQGRRSWGGGGSRHSSMTRVRAKVVYTSALSPDGDKAAQRARSMSDNRSQRRPSGSSSIPPASSPGPHVHTGEDPLTIATFGAPDTPPDLTLPGSAQPLHAGDAGRSAHATANGLTPHDNSTDSTSAESGSGGTAARVVVVPMQASPARVLPPIRSPRGIAAPPQIVTTSGHAVAAVSGMSGDSGEAVVTVHLPATLSNWNNMNVDATGTPDAAAAAAAAASVNNHPTPTHKQASERSLAYITGVDAPHVAAAGVNADSASFPNAATGAPQTTHVADNEVHEPAFMEAEAAATPAPSPPEITEEDAAALVEITSRMPILARLMSQRALAQDLGDHETAAVLSGLGSVRTSRAASRMTSSRRINHGSDAAASLPTPSASGGTGTGILKSVNSSRRALNAPHMIVQSTPASGANAPSPSPSPHTSSRVTDNARLRLLERDSEDDSDGLDDDGLGELHQIISPSPRRTARPGVHMMKSALNKSLGRRGFAALMGGSGSASPHTTQRNSPSKLATSAVATSGSDAKSATASSPAAGEPRPLLITTARSERAALSAPQGAVATSSRQAMAAAVSSRSQQLGVVSSRARPAFIVTALDASEAAGAAAAAEPAAVAVTVSTTVQSRAVTAVTQPTSTAAVATSQALARAASKRGMGSRTPVSAIKQALAPVNTAAASALEASTGVLDARSSRVRADTALTSRSNVQLGDQLRLQELEIARLLTSNQQLSQTLKLFMRAAAFAVVVLLLLQVIVLAVVSRTLHRIN